jgi:hypothetical protein
MKRVDVVLQKSVTAEPDESNWSPSLTGRFTSYGKRKRYPSDKNQFWAQSRYAQCGEEKNLLPAGKIVEPMMQSVK